VYRIFLILSIFFLGQLVSQAQIEQQTYRAEVVDSDTVAIINLPEVIVLSEKIFKNERERRKYNRTVLYVKKVYPYAKLAGEKLRYYDDTLRKIENERARKKFMQKIEDELKEDYEGELRKLTFTQGKILLKLIDRETNNTSYALLKDLRGGVSAVLWQGIGRVFGYNLKVRYDPEGEDKEIERIVQLIEMGAI
jgi:hypothetical protein